MPDIAVYFEKRDIWVGAYSDFQRRSQMWRLRVYICIVPCVPIRLTWRSYR